MRDENKKKLNDSNRIHKEKWVINIFMAIVVIGIVGGTIIWAVKDGRDSRARHAVEWAADRKVRAAKRAVEEQRAKINEQYQREQLRQWKKANERP